MSYKSYAEGGQFGKYYIDLPIKAEINEDLRAAGNFTKQMERSQKYREKWASSYLSALNEKSNIERQNRDDNFEFLQNNFKRIYEGEQREFEGRLAELRREQAEAANAEPGFIEKLVPMLMELAPMALNVIGGYKARSTEQALKETSAAGKKLIRHYQENGQNLIAEVNRIALLGGPDQRAEIAKLADITNETQETLFKFFDKSGIYRLSTEAISAERTGQQSYLRIDAARQGMPHPGDKNLALTEFSSQFEQQQAIDSELLRIQTELVGGVEAYEGLSDNVTAILDKSNGKFKNQVRNLESTNWENRYKDTNNAVSAYEVGNVAKNPHLFPDWLAGQTKIHELGGRVPTPIARNQSLELFNKHYNGTATDYQETVGRKMQEILNLKEIPAPGSTQPGGVWDTFNKKLGELRSNEVKAAREQYNEVTLRSNQAVNQAKLFLLNNPDSMSEEYLRTLADSPDRLTYNYEAQSFILNMASNRQAREKFVRTQNSFEFKTGLTKSDQDNIAYQAMSTQLAQGGMADGWKDRNITLKNRLVEYAKVKFQEIKTQNPNLNDSVAYEQAVTQAWTEMIGPNGDTTFTNRKADGTPEDGTQPIGTNWSSGSSAYSKSPKSKTQLIQRIKGWVQNGDGGKMPYFNWDYANSDGILRSVNNSNQMWKQKTGMEPTAAQVVNATNSEYIQTVTNTLRRAGIDKSASQVLNELGEAKYGKDWEPVKAITEKDLAGARGQARRDLEGLKPTSTTTAAQQAHLSRQPYQPSRFSPVRFYNVKEDATGEPGADFTHSGGNVNVSVLPGVIKELNTSYNPNRVGGDGQMGAGWGNHAVVEHIDPTNGKRFEAIYAHLAPEDFDKLQVGQQLEQFEPFARMGDKSDPRHLVGSLTSAHTSWDPYEVGSNDPYHNRKALLNYIRNLGRGNN